MNAIRRPNGIAPVPDGPWRLGAKGGMVARAWQHVWDRLDRTEYRDGVKLAEDAARALGVKPDSVRAMLHRAAAAGLLAQEKGNVELQVHRYSKTFTHRQNRTFYRIQTVTVREPS